MTDSEREFELGDVLSITTGILVARRKMDAVYDILNFMTGDNLYTHALPRAADACRPALLARHPWLAVSGVSEGDVTPETAMTWLEQQEATYGATVMVPTLAACEQDYRPVNPILELIAMRENA